MGKQKLERTNAKLSALAEIEKAVAADIAKELAIGGDDFQVLVYEEDGETTVAVRPRVPLDEKRCASLADILRRRRI